MTAVVTLTPRGLQVLRLSAAGHSHKDAAKALGISPETVLDRRREILRNLGAKNMVHAVLIAERAGLLEGVQS